MIQFGLFLAGLAAAAPALAAEGGRIESGEQPGFSRIVLQVEPRTEWSLETRDGVATLFFPGKALAFDTAGIFDLIPRTRMTGVRTEVAPDGTTVEVLLGCDCRVVTRFVNGNWLALDVADPDAPRDLAEPPTPLAEPPTLPAAQTAPALAPPPASGAAPEPTVDPAAAPPAEVGPEPGPEAEPETPEARARREMGIVASAEDLLIQQIERAADQGLIQLSDPTRAGEADPTDTAPLATELIAEPDVPVPADPPETGSETETAEMAPAAEAPTPVAEAPAHPDTPLAGAAPSLPDQGEATLPASPGPLVDLLNDAHAQIAATTVFDRDGRGIAARVLEPAVPDVCRPDATLDVGGWTNGLPLHRQVPALSRQIVGEFDRADPAALADLVRLYIRFGFGVEAIGLLAGFDVPFEERHLLDDLARAVEGRLAVHEEGLAFDARCPGRHGLWLALGGSAPAYRDEAQFQELTDAMAELPPDLRSLVAPDLVARLIEGGHVAEARVILDVAERPGKPRSPEQRLVAARVVAAEGQPEEAVQSLRVCFKSPGSGRSCET